MESDVAGQTPPKGQRRKLKRVVQKTKKSKVNLNSSSVAYYKKVKAALNASLNSSKTSQTLKANNKALAQSLQHIKQELRFALNENGRLKAENQDLLVQLRRLQNQIDSGQEQVNYELRLHSLKSVLNSMSHHLLDLGTCVNDAVDLCQCPTPRTSQSSASRPKSLEEFRLAEDVEQIVDEHLSSGLPNESALQIDLELDTKEENHPNEDEIVKSIDMSIILEQSLMDPEGNMPSETHMETVSEERSINGKVEPQKPFVLSKLPQRLCNVPSARSESRGIYQQNKKSSKRKCVTPDEELPKLDDGVRLGKAPQSPPNNRRETFIVCRETMMTSSESVEDICSITLPELVSGSPMKDVNTPDVCCSSKSLSAQSVEKSSDQSPTDKCDDKAEAQTTKSPTATEKASANNIKVSSAVCSQDKRKSAGKKSEAQTSKSLTATGKASTNNIKVSNAVCSKDKRKSAGKKSKSSTAETCTDKSKEPAAVCSKERRRSAEKKSESQSRNTRGTAPNHCGAVKPSQKDAEFFITNPCALNLVHKRVTGSSEGCLDSGTDDKQKPALNPVALFVAEIKEANRKSTKVASFIVTDAPESVVKARRSLEKDGVTQKPERHTEVPTDLNTHQKPERHTEVPERHTEVPTDLNTHQKPLKTADAQEADQTMYFDADMEFTAVLPQTQKLDIEPSARQPDKTEENEEASARTGEASTRGKACGEKQPKKQTTRSKSQPRSATAKADEEDKSNEHADLDKGGSGDDKKLAVALRVNKPGEMVFAASRKEDDGSRKAIPAKLQAKSRSKSKKRMEEMAKNLAQTEPESIFDFHDQTPRQAVNEGKSVFDLSLNETATGVAVSSLAALRDKMNTALEEKTGGPELQKQESANKTEATSAGQGKSDAVSLLGDMPVYSLPLKDTTSCEPEPKARSRGRSVSRGQPSGRQSRSRSKSKKDAEGSDGTINPDSSRGRSRSRSKKDVEGTADSAEPESRRGRSRNRKKPDRKDEAENIEEGTRRGRSRSRGRQPQEEETEQAEDNAEGLRRSVRSKSKGRKIYTDQFEENDSDDNNMEYVPPQEQHRGRSRKRKTDLKSGEEEQKSHGNNVEYVPPQEQHRGRSRKRKTDLKSGEEEQKSHGNDMEYVPPQEQHRGRSRKRKTDLKSGEEEQKSLGKAVEKMDNNHLENIGTREVKTENSVEALLSQPLTTCSNDLDGQVQGSVESSSTGNSDLGQKPLKMITDRRHRSRSSHRKLYAESKSITHPFQSPGKISQDCETDSAQDKVRIVDKKIRHRTRSRGVVLKEPAEGESQEGSGSKTSEPKTCLQQDEGREKRKSSVETSQGSASESSENIGSPSKKLRTDALRKSQIVSKNLAADEVGSENLSDGSKQDIPSTVNAQNSASVVKSRRSSLPVAVTRDEADKVQSTPTKATSKKGSKLSEPKSGEKKSIQAEFEEVKRKLKALGSSDVETPDADLPAQPIKKSRPLVLPPSGNSAPSTNKKTLAKPLRLQVPSDHSVLNKGRTPAQSKKGKSQPGSPGAKDTKSHGGSPVPMPQTKAVSPASAPHSPSSVHSDNTDDGSHADGRRIRRAASSVCYKEPSLSTKLRREDGPTPSLHIYKSPKGPHKRGKSGRVERGAFHDLTNLSITETSAE